jgi:H/ACA ribonucleoprotein complex subunit 3
MRFQLRKCPACKMYTMQDTCKKCNESTVLVHPAKFSPDDKYARLRIAEKEN